MAIERRYRIICDRCGGRPPTLFYDNPRRARAGAKHHGWQRRNMGEIRTREDGSQWQAWGPYQDLCPICLDRMDNEHG